MWPAAGISGIKLSAAFSARSGVVVASTRWMSMCSAAGCLGLRRSTSSVRATISRGALVRATVGHPIAPGPQVHHRLDVEHGDVEVGGELLVHGAHRLGVGGVVGRAVVGTARVALGQGVDERALTRRRLALERLRLLNQLVGVRLLVGLHDRVDVRAEHQRLAPVGDGQGRDRGAPLRGRPAVLRRG